LGNRSRTAISRREFGRRAAVASAVMLVPAGGLPATVPSPSSVTQQASPAPQLSSESQAEAEARYQAIVSAYGSRFSDAQKADLRRMSLEAQPALDRVRAYHLANGGTPALYLKPLVEREKKNTSPSASAAAPKAS
jgi:hypothetical protein